MRIDERTQVEIRTHHLAHVDEGRVRRAEEYIVRFNPIKFVCDFLNRFKRITSRSQSFTSYNSWWLEKLLIVVVGLPCAIWTWKLGSFGASISPKNSSVFSEHALTRWWSRSFLRCSGITGLGFAVRYVSFRDCEDVVLLSGKIAFSLEALCTHYRSRTIKKMYRLKLKRVSARCVLYLYATKYANLLPYSNVKTQENCKRENTFRSWMILNIFYFHCPRPLIFGKTENMIFYQQNFRISKNFEGRC